MTVDAWLTNARKTLQSANIDSAALDSELLLAFVLQKSRTWLIAHHDTPLSSGSLEKADMFLKRRKNREPLAYITGEREFYDRTFRVSPDTLIPRPESETLISFLHELAPLSGNLIDVGTGSGVLGITAALEFPELGSVTLSDISPPALKVAEENWRSLRSKDSGHLACMQSDLLSGVDGTFSYIVANLPYVDQNWQRSPETAFEPSLALFAANGGLVLIDTLISQTETRLLSGGYLLLEADPRQFNKIKQRAHQHQLTLRKEAVFTLCFQKI